MGLKFVVSEAQTRSSQVSQVSAQAQQAVASLQQSIQSFLSAPLSSKAYDSAKNYFMVAYTPICQSIIMTAEALESAHKKFLSEYQATVGGGDTDEDKIQEELDRYRNLLDTLDDLIRMAKTPRPDLEKRSLNVYQAMQKRQEKLDKLREYSGRSVSFFSDYEACQQELDNGVAQVKDCSAWNASTGSFDIKRLDMSWTKPINDRWNNKILAIEKKLYQKAKDWEELGILGYFKKYPNEYTPEKKALLELIIAKNGEKFDVETYMKIRKEGGYLYEISEGDFTALLLGANAKIINESDYNRFLLQGGAADLKIDDSYFKLLNGKIDGTTGWGYGFKGLKFNSETSLLDLKIAKEFGNNYISFTPKLTTTAGKVDAKINAYSDFKEQNVGAKIGGVGYNGGVGGDIKLLKIGKNKTPLIGVSLEGSAGVQADVGYENKKTKVQQLIPHIAVYSRTEELKISWGLGGKIKITYPQIGFN